MSTTRKPAAAVPAPALSPEQVQLIKNTIARGASDDDLALFLKQCERTGLDPFSRQIYCLKRSQRNDKGGWEERMETQVSIDGLRVIAERSGQHDGMEGPFWCGPDGAWRDVWLSDKPPAAARVVIWRKGRAHPFVGVATFRAYAQRKKDGTLSRFWETMPDHMLGKVAEGLALRRAFPHDLSGLYVTEEMPDEEAEALPAPAPAPAALPAPAPRPDAGGPALMDRLRRNDALLAERGWSLPGELLDHVSGAVAVPVGDEDNDPRLWTAGQAAAIVAAARHFWQEAQADAKGPISEEELAELRALLRRKRLLLQAAERAAGIDLETVAERPYNRAELRLMRRWLDAQPDADAKD